jgi:hypothetical protein
MSPTDGEIGNTIGIGAADLFWSSVYLFKDENQKIQDQLRLNLRSNKPNPAKM